MTIAVIGADGSGKSTLVGSLVEWLSPRVRTRTYYLGSARPSAGTWLIGLTAKSWRRAARVTARLLGPGHAAARGSASLSQLLADVRSVAEARERSRRAQAGRRDADAGAVVIFDRYPLDGVRLEEHPVDGPRIPTAGRGRLALRLAALEAEAYRRIPAPDHLLILDVDTTVAAGRRRPRDPGALRAKVAAIAGYHPPDELDHVRLDADQPQEEVLRQARSGVWSWL
jgi:thymidylate kinase